MKKIYSLFVLGVLPFAVCANQNANVVESKVATTATSDIVTTYYQDVDMSLNGEAFIDMLTPIINDGFKGHSYSYNNTVLAESDADPNNPGKIICFYTGQSLSSGSWNKEHVWAKSHGFSSESKDAYSDAHHLRPTLNSINSSRGNSDFDEVTNPSNSDQYGNKWTGSIFEPRDEVKGDVARIMFYMVVKYNNVDGTNLELVNYVPTSSSSGEGRFGNLDTLLKWHYQDPVSDFERNRNEVVYGYQNNRNPFIDHPEYVDNAFPNEYADQTVDEAKVQAVIAQIASLPTEITLDDKPAVQAAKQSYEALNYSERAQVTNYSILQAAIEKIEELEDGETNPPAVGEGDIQIDFTKHGQSDFGYTADKNFNIGDYSFYASNAGAYDGELRIGTNKEKTLPSKYNLGGIDAVALEMMFTVENLKSITANVMSKYGTYNKWYVLFKEDGSSTYEKISEGSGNEISATLPQATTGSFTIVFAGSRPRVVLSDFNLFTEEATATNPLEGNKTSASVRFTTTDATFSSMGLRFGGRYDKNLFKDATKFGVLVVKTSDLNGQSISSLYNNTNLDEFINSLADYSYLNSDATSTKALVDANGNVSENGSYYQFACVVTNILEHEKEELTAVVYAEINGVVYFMEETTYSFYSALQMTLTTGSLTDYERQAIEGALALIK